MRAFFEELKRRKVFGATATYFVVGWLVIEVASVLIPTLLLPEWSLRLITVIVLMGFPLVIALSWVFDITPRGIERTDLTETPADPEKEVPKKLPQLDQAVACVAVLPFDALSADDQHTVFAQGLTTEIHSLLVKHNRIQVLSRRAVASLSGKDLVDKLGARYLLTGNVVFDNDRVRIIAELDDAEHNVQIWSQRFERSFEDRLGVFSEIAEAVVTAFGVEHLRTELQQARSSGTSTENQSAWQLVQRARAYLLESGEDVYDQARTWLTEAVTLSPDYDAAHATLAFAISEQLLNGASTNMEEDIVRARDSINTALASAPHDPYVLKMAGMVWSTIGEPTRSCEVLERAVELTPFEIGAWGYLGWPLTARGRAEDIDNLLGILQRILKSSPDHPGAPHWHHHRAVALSCSGDLAAAESAALQSIEGAPKLSWSWMNLANIRAQTGNLDGAQQAASAALEVNTNMTTDHYVAQILRMNETPGYVDERTRGIALL
ncbi:MAG: tetratricopeptide repeat protein [Pseudomonadales bacterium]|nr:tetratricopeptide repeat protein [Pseudomonadales bacterium]